MEGKKEDAVGWQNLYIELRVSTRMLTSTMSFINFIGVFL